MEKYDQHNDLLVLVRMANHACRKMGIGIERDSAIILESTIEANLLGLSELAVAELQVKMEDSLLLHPRISAPAQKPREPFEMTTQN